MAIPPTLEDERAKSHRVHPRPYNMPIVRFLDTKVSLVRNIIKIFYMYVIILQKKKKKNWQKENARSCLNHTPMYNIK